jgi:hypothetical protein
LALIIRSTIGCSALRSAALSAPVGALPPRDLTMLSIIGLVMNEGNGIS